MLPVETGETKRPDLVVYCTERRKLKYFELTVCWESAVRGTGVASRLPAVRGGRSWFRGKPNEEPHTTTGVEQAWDEEPDRAHPGNRGRREPVHLEQAPGRCSMKSRSPLSVGHLEGGAPARAGCSGQGAKQEAPRGAAWWVQDRRGSSGNGATDSTSSHYIWWVFYFFL